MKEMGDPKGVYAKWHPPQEHRSEWANFFGDLVKVIHDSQIFGILSVARVRDLDRFNAERKLELQAYPLAAYGCMLLAARRNLPAMPVELIFDRVEKVASKLAKAREYADSDKNFKGECDSVVTTGLPNGIPLRDLPAMQAADFVAWEFRKHHERVSGWFDQDSLPIDADIAWNSLEQWIFDQHASHEAATRKSAAALIDNQMFANLVWDYRTLNEMHELRGGVWA
jgi:hypothetical protein